MDASSLPRIYPCSFEPFRGGTLSLGVQSHKRYPELLSKLRRISIAIEYKLNEFIYLNPRILAIQNTRRLNLECKLCSSMAVVRNAKPLAFSSHPGTRPFLFSHGGKCPCPGFRFP